jgi:hypothetical protein
MKKLSLIAGVASIAATAAVLWSVPVVADDSIEHAWHDSLPGQDEMPRENNYNNTGSGSSQAKTGVPEPGTLALFALGVSGLGLAGLSRRRPKS